MMLLLVTGCVASQYRDMCLDISKSLIYVRTSPLVRAAFGVIDRNPAVQSRSSIRFVEFVDRSGMCKNLKSQF